MNDEIIAWDGKSTDDISSVYEKYHSKPNFIDNILSQIHDVSIQKGGTWLLKKWLESGNKLKVEHIKIIYDSLHVLEHWESKLHVLQILQYMPIDSVQKTKVESFLRITLTDDNKFIRAWSYNGFYELASQHPEYMEEVKQFFEIALQDEAASVKARIRNIIKKGF